MISSLAFDEHGIGPRRAILLHGLLGSRRNVSSLAKRWAEAEPGRSVLAADLTGHGRSPPLPPGASLDEMAEDVLTLANELGIVDGLEIVGHSLGGRVALKAIGLAPEQVSRVTLVDMAPGPISPAHGGAALLHVLRGASDSFESRRQARDEFMSHGLSRALANWLAINLEPDRARRRVIWRVDREAIANLYERQAREDLWPILERDGGLGGRVTCVRGGASTYVADAEAQRLLQAGATVLTIEHAGHFVHVDAPERLVEILAGG